jgi:hypothetical protein
MKVVELTAGVTVRFARPMTPPKVALILLAPSAIVAARPICNPMVATDGLLLAQVALLVKACLEESL